MLILIRKKSEEIVIDGGKVIVKVVEIRGDKVRLGIDAGEHVTVHRKEVHDRIVAEGKLATAHANELAE